MKFDTETAAAYAAEKLKLLLDRAKRDTTEIVERNDIPTAVAHYAEFRAIADGLSVMATDLQNHVRALSYEILPTMMDNQGVKTIMLPEIGRVTVNVRWSASMLDKQKAMEWLRLEGHDGLIIETVSAGTLSSFAKAETMDGRPLPHDLFKVGTAQHISITKE